MNRLSGCKILFLSLLLLGGFSAHQASAQIQLLCTPDTNRMLLGDQQKIKLSVTADKSITNIKVHLDSISKVPGFEILREEEWVESQTAGSKILTKSFIFTAFNPGTYTFPKIAYTYEYNGRRDTGYSKPFTLTVFPVQTKSQEIEKNKDILEESRNLSDYLWWIIGSLLILATIILVIYYFKHKKQSSGKIKSGIPPAQTALQQLAELRASQLWASGEHKKYQYALTEIIRQYLNAQHGVRYSFTTGRILLQLNKWKWPVEWIQTIDESFRIADLVKFARAESQPEINLSYIGKLEEMIKAAEGIEPDNPQNSVK